MGIAEYLHDEANSKFDGAVIATIDNGRTKTNSLPQWKNKHKKTKIRMHQLVEERVMEEFERMFGEAKNNISRAIARGDKNVSMWFIDGYMKQRGSRISVPMMSDITTAEGLRSLSLEALGLARKGDMSLEQVKSLQDCIARHLSLEDSAILLDLKHQLEAVSLAMQSRTYGRDHMPAWGRLKAVTEQAEIMDDDDED